MIAERWECPRCQRSHTSRAIPTPIRCACGVVDGLGDHVTTVEVPDPPPGLLKKVGNYARAVSRWRAAGRPERTDDEVDALFRLCQQCDRFSNGHCTHKNCGCSLLTVASENESWIGLISRGLANKLRMSTEACPDGKWAATASKPRWITNQDRAAATLKLAGMVPSTVTAVAGVSRSGLSSAMQLSELLHLHPFAISLDGDLASLPHGYRFAAAAPDSGDLLIVDDTVASGTSLRRLRQKVDRITSRRRIWWAVTYANPKAAHLVDFCAETLPLPHFLEWNFFNSIHMPNAALDVDGILCRDCRPEEDDDGPAYAQFLAHAEPLYLPRREPVPLIVTARLEKYREQTEAWLSRWGVRCDHLLMGAWSTRDERRQRYSAADHKGRAFADSRASIFVESCPTQAREIFARAGKTVICPTTSEVWSR